MSQLSDIGKFRKTLEGMLYQVKQWLSREKIIQIEKFEFKLTAGMKIDPRGSIKLFVDSIKPYAQQILSDNDKFFYENTIEVDSEFIELHELILAWWLEFDEAKKDYMRARIKLLVMIAAIAVKDEELRQLINTFRDADNPLVF